MRVSCRRVVLIVVIVVAVAVCLGVSIVMRQPYRASTYGVADSAKAAVVVRNVSHGFYIIGLSITRRDGQSWDLGEAAVSERAVFPIEPAARDAEGDYAGGEQEVFSVEPGDYTLKVDYSDHPSLAAIAKQESLFYVHNRIPRDFAARAGSAVVFTLAAGGISGVTYTPPLLSSSCGFMCDLRQSKPTP